MAIRIVRAKIRDSQEIRALEQKVWNEKDVAGKYVAGKYVAGKYVAGKYDIATTIRFGYCFVAKDRDKIIGAVIAIKTNDDKVYIQDWFVKWEYRGKGIGKRLYLRLIETAKDLPVITFVHPKFKASLNVHKSIGFKIAGKVKDVYGLGDKDYRFLMQKS